MLIRRAQMDVFRKRSEEGLVDHALRFLRDELTPDVSDIPDDVLRTRIEWTLQRARSLGIDGGMGLQIFLALTFGVGPYFDRHPVVKKIVRDSTRPVNERMAAIFNDLSNRTWEEMAILAGAGEWDDDLLQTRGRV